MKVQYVTLLFLVWCFHIYPIDYNDPAANLTRDLEIVNYWNKKTAERLPVTFNHLLQGGYWNMPSARMGAEGEVGIGYSSVPPYRNYNLRLQLIDRLEVSGNYRVFKGVDDPILTPMGFGDRSDKGANVKICLLHPEDSNYALPGLAFGFEDFMGTRNFRAQYVVATQVLLEQNLELSLGYGRHRIRGFFGGATWFPFRKCGYSYLEGISLSAEYDAIPYRKEKIEQHPGGRVQKSPLNFGLKYRLWDQIDCSVSYVRGTAWAWSVSTFYNFGQTTGILPKVDSPLLYQAPTVTEPIGLRRPEEAVAQDLLYALLRQGFDLLEMTLDWNECGQQVLRLRVVNNLYRVEQIVRARLNNILAHLVPENIEVVTVVMETQGFPVQEYHFYTEYLREYADRTMGRHELEVLSPMTEVSFEQSSIAQQIFKQSQEWWNIEIFPRTHTFFGSSKGKFKYALGINVGLNGFLWDTVYYSMRVGCTLISNLHDVSGVDRLNPSQLINVRTDIVRYFRQKGLTIDQVYLQKNWNVGKGWYTKAAIGHFEEQYGGLATEVLYYPVGQYWAIGAESAFVRKRKVRGVELTTKIRKLEGFQRTYRTFRGSQYFLDMYYEWREAKLDFKLMLGKFLANDVGGRAEIIRYFPSGMRFYLWYTITNGRDRINGRTYHDKGVGVSMPLDIFYTHADRSRWGYGMSAWLRDVGATSYTGMKLYDQIREQRLEW